MKLITDECFAKIYFLYINKGKPKINVIEEIEKININFLITEDDKKNEKYLYEKVFFSEEENVILHIFMHIKDKIKKISYVEATDLLKALEFVQEITATAMWKYGINVSEELSQFTREFDRIDIEFEKIRFYNKILNNRFKESDRYP
jgi:hypothetical protein